MTLHEMQRRLSKFNITKEVVGTIKKTRAEIIKLNRAQMYSGLRATGSEIRPPYAPLTIFLKKQKGQPVDRVTLKDTGDFYNAMFVEVNDQAKFYEIDSKDEKSLKLQRKYQPTIFGLGDESSSIYLTYTMFPELKSRIETKLGVEMT